ncbi:MurR/RpiR family transcriptional regulator [Rosenbergiella nectarea]|uniref:MurR/RpiR family transcriptional regulator n=1 Tax=Rosenbergiella nectarea TaxID=988801 RepID=UPI001F4E5504|nr:MurR/RpiR family transcriptional regulator [Rosenbergiella nectarea]
MDLRKLIIDHYPALTPELQRAAAFVLENINDVALISMRTIAHNADLKPATLSRLAKKLGYEGWEALKAEFIYSLKLTRSSYASRAVRLQQNLQQESAYDAVFSTLSQSLEDTQALNQDSLQRAVTLLDDAQQVYVCGFRASFSIAWSIYYVYRLFQQRVTLIDNLANSQQIFTRELTDQDSVLLVSFSPYSRETLQILETAQQVGAKIVAITDSPSSPLAQVADCTLLFSIDSASFFPSVVSGMAIAEALLASLVAKHGEPAVQSIEKSEKYLFDSGSYIANR